MSKKRERKTESDRLGAGLGPGGGSSTPFHPQRKKEREISIYIYIYICRDGHSKMGLGFIGLRVYTLRQKAFVAKHVNLRRVGAPLAVPNFGNIPHG